MTRLLDLPHPRQRFVPLILQLAPCLLERRYQVLVVCLGILESLIGAAQIGIEILLSCLEALDTFFELEDALTQLL